MGAANLARATGFEQGSIVTWPCSVAIKERQGVTCRPRAERSLKCRMVTAVARRGQHPAIWASGDIQASSSGNRMFLLHEFFVSALPLSFGFRPSSRLAQAYFFAQFPQVADFETKRPLLSGKCFEAFLCAGIALLSEFDAW